MQGYLVYEGSEDVYIVKKSVVQVNLPFNFCLAIRDPLSDAMIVSTVLVLGCLHCSQLFAALISIYLHGCSVYTT